MAKGRKRLENQIQQTLGRKADKPKLVPAMIGAYVNGQKTLTVAGREDFVWCRIRGSTSEVVQAFNDVVGPHWDLPVLIYRDPNHEGLWKVYSRDVTQYQDWEGVSYLPHHGNQHSFRGGQGAGSDPVWVYKRQFMPFLPRPVASGNMSIYIEQDLYYWDGEYHWWGGSGTEDLTSFKPTGSVSGKFLTVYIEGSSETLKILEGDEFNLVFAPDNPTEYIPVPNPNEGIPIASVILQTGTQNIGWHEIFDLRLTPTMYPQTGSNLGVYDEHVFQGGVSNLDFVGDDVSAVVSGSYAYVEIDIADVVFPEEEIGVYGLDDGEPLGTGTSIDWGNNLDASLSGTVLRVDSPLNLGIYDEGIEQGEVANLNFIGDEVSAVVSGSYAHVEVDVADPVFPEEEIGVYGLDDGEPLGTGTTIDWGDNLDVSLSGTRMRVDAQAGGGGGGSGSVVILDEGIVLGSAEEIDYVGAGIEATVSGTRARVEVSSGPSADTIYSRAAEAEPVGTRTGTFWKVPDEEFVTGSLAVFINGIAQRPVTDYEEQHAASGTFELTEAPPTGTYITTTYGI